MKTLNRFEGSSRPFRGAALAAAVLAAITLAGTAPDARAGDPDKDARELAAIREAVKNGELLPLPRILELALAKVPGDVVKTKLESEHGRLIYEVKVLTETGRVREVELDARNGEVLKVEDD